MPRRALVQLAVIAALAAPHAVGAQPAPPATAVGPQLADADPTTVFRFDPFLGHVVAVPAAEVKPGFLYNRYHPQLRRRVWSVAVEGGFEYAMAPGSTQPARMLDLRATPQQQREELIARAPELAKMIEARGGVAHVRLGEDQSWTLVRNATIPNVFDLETGRRWEWHGQRRVAVVHTAGYEWQFDDGKALPAFYTLGGGAPPCW